MYISSMQTQTCLLNLIFFLVFLLGYIVLELFCFMLKAPNSNTQECFGCLLSVVDNFCHSCANSPMP